MAINLTLDNNDKELETKMVLEILQHTSPLAKQQLGDELTRLILKECVSSGRAINIRMSPVIDKVVNLALREESLRSELETKCAAAVKEFLTEITPADIVQNASAVLKKSIHDLIQIHLAAMSGDMRPHLNAAVDRFASRIADTVIEKRFGATAFNQLVDATEKSVIGQLGVMVEMAADKVVEKVKQSRTVKQDINLEEVLDEPSGESS